ncbi:MAG: ribonuclease P protein component [Nocardioides sp.]
MLSSAHRLTDGASFRMTVRKGRRCGARTVVVHLATGADDGEPASPPQVGFVVSKAVGNAVVRNRVKRRLRHLARERVSELPPGAILVVRAQPAAATASTAVLSADLDRCLDRALTGAKVAP